ncbi:hypothetical protein BJX66DRAFT_352309 [Aspergillus keveii]|uniref:AAA+ ATPase domain-containing protein n=1 Tax=Aspergillus keveii TaxID=714993 RepID=A0ABR4GK57_9EURO
MEPVPTPAESERTDIFDAVVGEPTPPTPAMEASQTTENEGARIPKNTSSNHPRSAPLGNLCESKLSAEQIEYQRKLSCLYRHRKDFETAGGPADWNMYRTRHRWLPTQPRDGPWDYIYDMDYMGGYERPDPFDPTHECNTHHNNPNMPNDFDLAIDYGERRASVRKHFEWELDRLYLMEELYRCQQRRKMDEAEAKKAQEDEARVAMNAPSAMNDGSGTQDDGENKPGPMVAELILTKLQWHTFKHSAAVDRVDCQIEVLIGEPIVQDERLAGFTSWYGFSGYGPQKVSKVEQTTVITAPSGETALFERVRIRSLILNRILEKIEVSVVFIRPFKLLTYCERALRDWCKALKNKYALPPVSGGETSLADTVSTVPEENVSAVRDSESADDHIATEKKNRDDIKREEEEEAEEEENEDESTKSPEALQHLECLLRFIDNDIVARRSHLGDHQCRKVFFSDLWHLFRPGMEVISSNGKQVYRVVHVRSARHRVVPAWERYHDSAKNNEAKAPFSLTCVYIDFDGKSLGPVSSTFDFKRFDVSSRRQAEFDEEDWPKIEALSPPERTSFLRQRFIERGKMFLNVAQVKHMYYAGPTIGVRDEVESQVVVDFETAFAVDNPKQQAWKPELEILLGNSGAEDEEDTEKDETCQAACCRRDNVHDDMYIDRKQRTEYIDNLLPKGEQNDQQPSIAILPRPLKELLRTSADKELSITPDELVIMSYRVFGFILRTRKWARLDLFHLTEVHTRKHEPATRSRADSTANAETKEPTTFSRLVLNEKHKHMIVSLIAQHFRDKKSISGQREQVDIVRGKGKGLILLLHGAPGVGKTSTAEGVAELFQKPLFQITCGDLGTTAKEVETALETNFALANRWDCILLLDEADVFLSQRTKDDFQRNGLVAVFLRVMEYYAGILFLTTNRVGDFDEAFTSRIHVSLYYPDLTDKQTVEIFKLNLGMIEERFRRKGRQIKIDDVDIILFANNYFKEHPHGRWNGRQIRNACQTALALAEYEAQEAQGDDPQNSVKTDAAVNLTVAHFAVVSDAYLEFIDYINRLFGTNSSRGAHEDKLRAFLADANDSLVASLMDKKAAQPQSQYPAPPTAPPPADPYYGYNQPAAAPGGYLNPNAMPPQRQPYGSNEWNSMPQSPPRRAHTPEPSYIPAQQSPQARMQIPRSAQYPNQPIPQSFNELEPPYTGQELSSGLPSAPSGNAPPQGWQTGPGTH